MGLLDKTQNQNQTVEDSIKILSTNLEEINQRLASSAPGGQQNEPGAEFEQKIDEVSKKLNQIANYMKSSQDNLHQEIAQTKSQFDSLRQAMDNTEKNVTKHVTNTAEKVKEHMTTERGNINNLLQSHTNFLKSELGKQADLTKQNYNISSKVTQELEKLQDNIPQELDTITKKLNELDLKASSQANTSTGTKKQKTAAAQVPSSLIDDVQAIRKELETRHKELASGLIRLVKINRGLLDSSKKGKELDNMDL